MSPADVLRPQWPAPAAVRAVCTQRTGGESRAPYDSLNLATHVGDEATAVANNRLKLRRALHLPAEPLWLAQVHGADVVRADTRRPHATALPEGDAAITRQPGQVLAILVADCLPVLLCSQDGLVVAAAHAGWRGLAAGVLEATVTAFEIPGGELLAWLGPAIGQEHFEVGPEVRAAFCDRDPAAATAFRVNSRERWQCDLHLLAEARLRDAGVRSIHGARHCTFSRQSSFFSYRRDGVTGRCAALIWIEPGHSQ